MLCPLCNSKKTKVIEEIDSEDITNNYSKNINVNTSDEFIKYTKINFMNCHDCDLYYFDPLITGKESFYNQLQKFDWYYPEHKNEFNYVAKLITSDSKVLEVGSGKGAFAKLIPNAIYTGLEFSENAIDLAKKNDVNIINQSIQEHAKLNKENYDFACSFQVLEHVSDVNSFISSMVDCLKPGGKLILSVPSYDSFSRYIHNFDLDMPPHHVTRWTDRALDSIARVFSLKREIIWHEPLQAVHADLYATSTIFNIFNHSLLSRRQAVIDNSYLAKVLVKLSSLFARIYIRFVKRNLKMKKGISVTVVFTKFNNKG